QLGAADRIHSAVTAWRRSVAARGSADALSAGLLRARLWDPITKHLGGIDTVLIAPDGELAGLPFAALPGDERGRFLLERYVFGYLSSGRQLLLPSAEVEGDGLLVLGGGRLRQAARHDRPAGSAAHLARVARGRPGGAAGRDSLPRRLRRVIGRP